MKVLVDGQVVARLWRGSSAHIRVKPGSHRVQARMDWCRSPELEVFVGETGEAVVEVAISMSSLSKIYSDSHEAIEIRAVVD